MPSTSFNNGLNGWTTTNGTEIFDAIDGDPPGSLRGTEGGSGLWYFSASPKYLGDMSGYYGGELSFDLRQDGAAKQLDEPDVILTGGGITLAYDFGPNPGTDWTHYSVDLALGEGWHIGSLTGRMASDLEIRTVLANLDSLLIRGEFVYGAVDDAANLDNVALVTGPPPPPPVFQGGDVVSDFSTGIDGWAFNGDVKQFRQVASDGNPGGYLEMADYATGPVCYFIAPEKFRGDKAEFYGGTLGFDLRQSKITNQVDRSDVIISGGGLTIVLDTSYNPGLDWTHYQVGLDVSSDWRIDKLSGAVATEAQIRQVLADITDMQIRGEFVNGPDTNGLDNVVMSAGDANVRLLSDASTGALLSNHDTLAQALLQASLGNAILIEDAAGAGDASYAVKANGLTVISDAALTSTLALKGVTAIALSGGNDMSVTGNARDNVVFGSDGDNRLRGLKGDDSLHGGNGRDVLIGNGGADLLLGDAGHDKLNGGGGKDRLKGGDGNDLLFGKAGNDVLKGGGGKDTLDGGAGNDKMYGNAGSDSFRFSKGFGNDTIYGFDANDDNEVIDLSRIAAITDFTDLSANHMDTVPGGVLIDDLAGNTIFLKGVDLADLHDADFNF